MAQLNEEKAGREGPSREGQPVSRPGNVEEGRLRATVPGKNPQSTLCITLRSQRSQKRRRGQAGALRKHRCWAGPPRRHSTGGPQGLLVGKRLLRSKCEEANTRSVGRCTKPAQVLQQVSAMKTQENKPRGQTVRSEETVRPLDHRPGLWSGGKVGVPEHPDWGRKREVDG